MRLYDAVAFGIECDGADGSPVSGVGRPTSWVAFASLAVQGMSGSQNCVIVPCMTLSRADVTNAAMTMLKVVPVHKAGRPGAGLIEVGKALGGELGAVLGGTKQRLGIGVVVADARPGIRGFDAQPV